MTERSALSCFRRVGRGSGKRNRLWRAFLPTVLAALVLAAASVPAFALDHLMRIGEVYAGVTGQPDAELVELQMFQDDQDQVEGNIIHIYDAAGTEIQTYAFPDPPGPDPGLPNEDDQSSILIGTAQAATFFGVTPDLLVPPGIPAAGGQACYEDVDNSSAGIIDCASWGSYAGVFGDPFFSGTPFNAGGGIVNGQSMLRDISGGTSPALLDESDDANDSAADFDLANPDPRNNANDLTDTAATVASSGGVLSFEAAGRDRQPARAREGGRPAIRSPTRARPWMREPGARA